MKMQNKNKTKKQEKQNSSISIFKIKDSMYDEYRDKPKEFSEVFFSRKNNEEWKVEEEISEENFKKEGKFNTEKNGKVNKLIFDIKEKNKKKGGKMGSRFL